MRDSLFLTEMLFNEPIENNIERSIGMVPKVILKKAIGKVTLFGDQAFTFCLLLDHLRTSVAGRDLDVEALGRTLDFGQPACRSSRKPYFYVPRQRNH